MSADIHSKAQNSVAVLPDALSILRKWRDRARSRRELAALSEYELQDMGTCRASISDEISKPFWRP